MAHELERASGWNAVRFLRRRMAGNETVETNLPLRLDVLPWSRWHWRVVIALGVTWILDGLEVTLVGSLSNVLTEPETLHLTEGELGMTASAYLAGAILGALFFGRLTDHLGRKKLFLVTLSVYLVATLLTSLSVGFLSFAFFRAVTGAGIGGEYAAINATIDELLPARVRGRADVTINGTYWAGTALGAASTLILLDPRYLPHSIGWRICFGLGAVLGFCILFVRKHLPESPRWLVMHGRSEEAERIVSAIEDEVRGEGHVMPPLDGRTTRVEVRRITPWSHIARVLLVQHRRRAVLGFVLMVTQAFAYNGIFFTYPLVLGRFYGVKAEDVGLYLLPFALGNLLGPIFLGPLFDKVGRRIMISATYGGSAVLLAVTAFAFVGGTVGLGTLTVLWCCVFFVTSAAASSAYLTVSELFPVELRAMAIAIFFAVGTAAGGLLAPSLFGALVETGSRLEVFRGYMVGAGLMGMASIAAALLSVAAERRSLEEVAAIDDVRRELPAARPVLFAGQPGTQILSALQTSDVPFGPLGQSVDVLQVARHLFPFGVDAQVHPIEPCGHAPEQSAELEQDFGPPPPPPP
jgi:MFS family permease